MTKKDFEQMQKMMILTFNDGFEQVVMPRLEELDEKMDKMKKELKEEFKRGQQSLSNRLEEMEIDMSEVKKNTSQMNGKMDQILEKIKIMESVWIKWK